MNERIELLREGIGKVYDFLDSLEEPDKYTWMMAIAGDMLHEVPDELRDSFLKDYNKLKEYVVRINGDAR